jgi:hypothetical protein
MEDGQAVCIVTYIQAEIRSEWLITAGLRQLLLCMRYDEFVVITWRKFNSIGCSDHRLRQMWDT